MELGLFLADVSIKIDLEAAVDSPSQKGLHVLLISLALSRRFGASGVSDMHPAAKFCHEDHGRVHDLDWIIG